MQRFAVATDTGAASFYPTSPEPGRNSRRQRENLTVRHYRTNPRNNTSHDFKTKSEAVAELRAYTSDERGSNSHLEVGGKIIASRDWDKSRISWHNPPIHT